MTQRTCEMDNCQRPHSARGLCITHYNQQHQPNRHRKVAMTCAYCGTSVLKQVSNRHPERFCSLACREARRKATGAHPVPTGAESWTRKRRARVKLARAARGTKGDGVLIAGLCHRCGAPYTTFARGDKWPRYCSNVCSHRADRSRRRALKRSAVHVPYSRHGIFERDKWRCHLCRRKTDRTKAVPHAKAPTIDHLIPLFEGGDDTAANVATACFLCNSIKGERGGGEQLALL